MRINALGTIYVNEEFTKVMGAKSCIIDVASMAGHMMPDLCSSTAWPSKMRRLS